MGQAGVLRAGVATRPAEVWVMLRRIRADSIRARKSTDFRYKPNICPSLTPTLSSHLSPCNGERFTSVAKFVDSAT
jgi:hypothetical protein